MACSKPERKSVNICETLLQMLPVHEILKTVKSCNNLATQDFEEICRIERLDKAQQTEALIVACQKAGWFKIFINALESSGHSNGELKNTQGNSHQETSKSNSEAVPAGDTDDGFVDYKKETSTSNSNAVAAGDTDKGVVDYKKGNRYQAPQHLQLKQRIVGVVTDKDSLPFDFWQLLLIYKKHSFSVMELVSEDNLNILQYCIEKGKLSFLLIIVYIGWWKTLSQQIVPAAGPEEYRGKTARDIAESKKLRKAVDEFTNANELENSLSPLMKAIRCDDSTKVMDLIKRSPQDLYNKDFNQGNVLTWAIVAGSVETFKQLLSCGVDYSIRTKKKENLLHIACLLGRTKFIPILIRECKLDLWLEDTGHKTPLDRVAENGDITTLKAFIDCGVQPKPHCVVICAFLGRLQFLIHCVENLKININSTDLYGRTPIHRACEAKRVLIVNYLLPKRVDLLLPTCTNKNIFHFLAEAGDLDLAKVIIGKISKPEILKLINQRDLYTGEQLCFLIRGRDKGRDAFHYVEVERAKVPNFHKKTKSGNVDVATFGTVIKSGWGVNPSQDDIDEIEDMFKSRKFDTTSAPDTTPLHAAVFKGHYDIAVLYLNHGAEVNVKERFGNTPVMLAASRGDKNMILELERRGANLHEVNNKGMTAVEIADDNQQDDTIHLMQGQELAPLCQNFVHGPVDSVQQMLSRAKLDEVRRSGGDIKRYIIDALRNLRVDVNQFLVDMGSGPVQQATD